jgi:formate-dependent nitrite reductase membrane component NrfD
MNTMHDGRSIDTAIGLLEGEASHQQATPPGNAPMIAPSLSEVHALGPTYYGRPVLKEPVWIWTIPTYFLVGGIAGAAMTMGLAVQIFGGRRLRGFDERCRWTGAVAGGIGSALLIMDLGRKSRFLMMLRVFRPTSPMSIGSWVLAIATPLSAGSAIMPAPFNRMLGVGAGVLGMPLATYTGVLLGNTAVPLWNSARRSLPLLFGASSMASMAALFNLMDLSARERRIVRRFGVIGQSAELLAAAAVEHDAHKVPRVAKPLRDGFSGMLWSAASVCTAGALVLSLLPGQGKRKRYLTAALGLAGGACVRFSIFYAGKRSARDPHAAFMHQP